MPTTLTLPRWLLWLLALLLAAASAAYSALWMYYTRAQPRARLGIVLDESSRTGGILVTEVVEGAPVARAGLQAGDRIVGVNGRPLETWNPFYDAVTRGQPGDVVEVESMNEVLGVLDATSRIPDGSQVAVDGVAGVVRWMS